MTDVSPTEASDLQSSHKFIDVRTAEEFSGGHPIGAINIPVMVKSAGGMAPNPEFASAFEAENPDKSADLLISCQSGKRSMMACSQLSALGYTSLKNVSGGYASWVSAGLPVDQ